MRYIQRSIQEKMHGCKDGCKERRQGKKAAGIWLALLAVLILTGTAVYAAETGEAGAALPAGIESEAAKAGSTAFADPSVQAGAETVSEAAAEEPGAEAAPAVQVKESSQTADVKAGGNAVFTVKAEGTGLKYRWQKMKPSEDVWKDSHADGSRSAILTVTEVKPEWNGMRYRCMVTDQAGNKVYSKPARLYVLAVTKHPETRYVKRGATAVLKVAATGRGLQYRWQKMLPSEDEWVNSGSTGNRTATLKVTDAKTGWSGIRFRCKITDAAGKVTYSKAARVYVLGITKNPTNQSVRQGSTAVFRCSSVGAGRTFQWQVKEPSDPDWRRSSSSGCTTSTLKVYGKTAYNGFRFRCKVTDAAGNTVYTKSARLNVSGITRNPSSQKIKAGSRAVFRVRATGAGIRYAWQVKSPNGGWRGSGSSGHSTNTLKVTGRTAYNGYRFRCKVTDGKGRVFYSKAASLHVLGITGNPLDQLVPAGRTAIFRVRATGAGLRYQWQYREHGGASWKASGSNGHNTSILNVAAKWNLDAYQFRCRVRDSKGNTVYSRVAMLWIQ